MQLLRLVLVLLCCSFVSFAQQINKYDSQGRRHGIWQKRYQSGRIRYIGEFHHGNEVGEFVFYQNKIVNNYPSIRKTYSQDNKKAHVVFYDLNGKKVSEGTMIGKNKVGEWFFYDKNQEDEVVVLKENYANGFLNGERTVYYTDGNIAEQSTYINDKLDGISTRYAKNGVKLHTMTYQQGLLHGRSTFYETNGVLKESGLYFKDFKVGNWDYYLEGVYMGFKQPNKQKSHPDDEAILASIGEKNAPDRPQYEKLSDEQILENIETKNETDELVYEQLSDEDILANIEKKRSESEKKNEDLTDGEILANIRAKNENIDKPVYTKASDDEILKSIAQKMEVNNQTHKLTDYEILQNIEKKKQDRLAEEARLKKRKLSDNEILKNIERKKKEATKGERKKVEKLSDEQILRNINGTK